MSLKKSLRALMIVPVLAAVLAGCDSSGSTPDAGKSTAPPVTKENAADVAKSVNDGAGGLMKGSPGVK